MIQQGKRVETATNFPKSVFSAQRTIHTPLIRSAKVQLNTRLKMKGITLLESLARNTIPLCFFDPQYRGILDKMRYGNEGVSRGKERSTLPQMNSKTIEQFIQEIGRVLIPSGHLFLWIDKFHLCEGYQKWLPATLETVDLIVWHKDKIGMGYRTRRSSEYLVVLQKIPKRAKGVWKIHTIPDVWTERIDIRDHTHRKPTKLQSTLIEAVSNCGDVVLDPAAGSFSVWESAQAVGRNFIGCDILG